MNEQIGDSHMIVYEDSNCQIELIPAEFPGCYFVTVDDDPEHYLSTSATSLVEAEDIIEEIKAEIFEVNGQFGVGA
jgi:hypothetical protein